MRTGQRHRRSIALVTAGALGALLALLPSGAAQASIAGEVVAQSGTSLNAAPCTRSGTIPPGSHAPYANGTAVTSTSLAVRYTANADSTDTVDLTGSLVVEGDVAQRGGGLHSFSVNAKSTLEVDQSKGAASLCAAVSGALQGGTTFDVATTHNSWLYLTRNQPKDFFSQALIQSSDGTTPLYDLYAGPRSKQTIRVFLPTGSYEIGVALVQGTPNEIFTRSLQSSSMSGLVRTAGAALGPARGSATPYVGFPASVSCPHHSATLSWSAQAGHVASAVFKVNGARSVSVSHPQAGAKVTLKHLRASADATVTAALLMKGGAKTSATRTYLACTK